MNGILTWIAANQGVIVAMATVVIAVMAFLTWQVTRTLARENTLLRKAETEPKVVAYLAVHPQHLSYINFVLANVGRGPAQNVKFQFISDMGETDIRTFGVEFWNSNNRTAIGFLPQGEKISIPMGAALLSEPRCPAFEVSIEYQDLEGRRYDETCRLDASQFEGFSQLGTPPEQKMGDALEKLSGDINSCITGFRRLKVETMTADEVRTKHHEFAESLKNRNSAAHATAGGEADRRE